METVRYLAANIEFTAGTQQVGQLRRDCGPQTVEILKRYLFSSSNAYTYTYKSKRTQKIVVGYWRTVVCRRRFTKTFVVRQRCLLRYWTTHRGRATQDCGEYQWIYKCLGMPRGTVRYLGMSGNSEVRGVRYLSPPSSKLYFPNSEFSNFFFNDIFIIQFRWLLMMPRVCV